MLCTVITPKSPPPPKGVNEKHQKSNLLFETKQKGKEENALDFIKRGDSNVLAQGRSDHSSPDGTVLVLYGGLVSHGLDWVNDHCFT